MTSSDSEKGGFVSADIAQVLLDNRNLLVDRLHRVCLELAFENHHNLHPRKIREISDEEAGAFLEFLQNNSYIVKKRGQRLLELGLGRRTVASFGSELSRFCWDQLSGFDREAIEACLEASVKYSTEVLVDYMEAGEAAILAKQEQLRRALSKTLDQQRLELYVMENAINTSINGIMLIDLEGRINYVNSAFLSMWGYEDPNEVLGTNSFELWGSPEIKQAIRTLGEDSEEGWRGEYTARRRDRTAFEVEISASLIRDDRNEPRGIMVSYVDVSERKQSERDLRRLEEHLFQSQKIEAIGTLASGIAHDFNNILQAISGYLQLVLTKGNIDLASQRYLSEVDFAVDRASDLVHRLLTFSRKVKPTLKVVDLNSEVVRAVKMLERTIPKMINIEMHLAGDLAPVNGDANQLEQVLMNLGANARDAMPNGGRLAIETRNVVLDSAYCKMRPEAEPGRYVRLRVSDTGCGMGPETIKHIFDPFFTTKGVGEGTGLGLSSVYGVVKSHGGHITCDSQVERGAVFDIFLPVSNNKNADLDNDAPPMAEACSGLETILVVDDEKAILEITEDILLDHGYKVLTAESGEKMLEVYREQGHLIDLVVLDLGMPGRGGLSCLKELLRMDDTALAIIASGYSADGEVRDCLDLGAAGFISKPYRLTEMLKIIRRTLDSRAPRRRDGT